MKRNQVIKLAVALALLGTAGYLIVTNWSQPDPDTKDIVYWMCQDAKCRHEFQMTGAQLVEYINRDVPCPTCSGVNTRMAFKCPLCSKLYPPVGHAQMPDKCPHCKEKLPRPKPRGA